MSSLRDVFIGYVLSFIVLLLASLSVSCERNNKYTSMVERCEAQSIYQCELKAVKKGENS